MVCRECSYNGSQKDLAELFQQWRAETSDTVSTQQLIEHLSNRLLKSCFLTRKDTGKNKTLQFCKLERKIEKYENFLKIIYYFSLPYNDKTS